MLQTNPLSLNEILVSARKHHASDVHLTPNCPVIFRQYSHLKNATDHPLSPEQIYSILTAALPPAIVQKFESSGDADYVHNISGHGRFRMTILKQRNGYDMTARLIPNEIPAFDKTGMPPACADLTKWAQGLVLITGPAGCGKTTSMASLVEMINQERPHHIITIEQPIEIVYGPKKCQVTQREVNIHTLSQDNALRAALREDPDILVVSELRDLSTIQLVMTAAETGHLVFGTMNTVNASQTLSRLIDSFPTEEQPIVRNMISESLRGIICQQLIPKKDGSGMVAAYEVLLITAPVANLIREGKIGQIINTMATAKSSGMVMMDASLETLVRSGTISVQEACDRAINPILMTQLFK